MNNRHTFGGDWTKIKLECLEKYLKAYTKVMKNQSFNCLYIDAFAGSGWITLKQNESRRLGAQQSSLFDLLDSSSNCSLQKQENTYGSARLALTVEPHFNEYHFIENNQKRFLELENLKSEYPHRIIQCHQEDANYFLQNLCIKRDWINNYERAVLFLDPYGMNVQWKTIKSIAATKAIDIWYLFPMGIALNRLLRKDGQISPKTKLTISGLLGTDEWYDVFYRECEELTLFGTQKSIEKNTNFINMSEYINSRFENIFPGVANNPRSLFNSRNNPLYLLIFAASNDKGSKIAIKIAQSILGNAS